MGDGKDDFTPANYIQLELTESGEGGKDQLTGGLGDDTIRGNAGDDYSDGGGGDDYLSDGYAGTLGGGLGSGNDYLIGNAGDDYLDGGSFAAVPDAGSGADVLDGGLGLDTADYSKRTVPLTLTEGDGANDGQDTGAGPGSEGDNLVSAETILGGSAGDLIAGADGDNTLSGGAGNDVLRGAGGADILRGGNGDDWLEGGAGPDLLQGGHGIDTASYATAPRPGEHQSRLGSKRRRPRRGGQRRPGHGERRGRLGRRHDPDDRRCDRQSHLRRGHGHVRADAFDAVAADCETVSRSALPDPGTGALAALGLPKRLKVRHGAARLKVTCPPAPWAVARGQRLGAQRRKDAVEGGVLGAAGESAAVVLKSGRKVRGRRRSSAKVSARRARGRGAGHAERVTLR